MQWPEKRRHLGLESERRIDGDFWADRLLNKVTSEKKEGDRRKVRGGAL